jgi:hypothetical protein
MSHRAKGSHEAPAARVPVSSGGEQRSETVVPSTAVADVLWKMCNEHYTQGRHHETQRSAVVSAIIAIAAAITGLVTVDGHIESSDIPLTVLLIALGLFGSAFSMKHYERFRFHMECAKQYRNQLDQLLPDAPLRQGRARARSEHKHFSAPFPSWTRGLARRLPDLRLHYWWLALNLFIAALGVALSVSALA